MVNLIVDEGNTLCKIAVVDSKELVCDYALAEFDVSVAKELVEKYAVTHAIVASTRGGAEGICQRLKGVVDKVLHFTSMTDVPIEVEYASRTTLGTDRIATAVGTVKGLGITDALIVDMGSAITFDLVEGGAFKGGNISLGVAMRFKALHEHTAALPLCSATEPNGGVGHSTVEAIEQGVMQGVLYEIEGYISHFCGENSGKSVIFCGGDAESFVNRIKNAIFAPRKLSFTGLNEILEYNVKKGNI